MENKIRRSGILLHITSLPNKYGWGKFSKECYNFIDFLKAGGFKIWQVLPFNPSCLGCSPYSTNCSSAINPIFLDITQYLTEDEIKTFNLTTCNSLQEYYDNMYSAVKYVAVKLRNKFDLTQFIKSNSWVIDYASFVLLKQIYNCTWYNFPSEFKNRNNEKLKNFYIEYDIQLKDIILIQYLLSMQWKSIKDYANKNGIKILGDIPFYCEYDSVDVWTNSKCFQLENGKPKLVAGVPPDYFNSEGQLWGNPVYDYDYLEKKNYKFFIDRFKRLSQMFDIIRIDHFLAFNKYWAIPYSSKSAKRGKWLSGGGEKLLEKILNSCKSEIIVEDLGIISNEVRVIKEKFNLAGLKVLQFAFDSDFDNEYKPHNYEKNCIAYIGTHDNNTFMGMLNEGNWDKINRFKRYFQMPLEYENDVVVDNAIISLYRSSANDIILTMQDILKLGSESRMNIPGQPNGNWQWQLKQDFDFNLCSKFSYLANLYAR